jgi:cytochrome b561
MASRSQDFSAHACSLERMVTALYGCLLLGAVMIGVLSLLGASWLRQVLESWINIHVLFGLLLCGLVFARCRWCVRHSFGMLPPDIRKLSRHLSCIIYLLLYLVIGVRAVIGVLNSNWHGGTDDHLRNGSNHAIWNPKDDFQMFFASGLFALLFVPVLAFRLWLHFVKRAAISTALTQE